MGVYTVINQKIKKLIEPGWIYSSVNQDRLIQRLSETIDKNLQKDRGAFIAPDRFEVYVNNSVFQEAKHASKIRPLEENLANAVKRHIETQGYAVFQPEFSVILKADALLDKRDINLRCLFSEGDELVYLERKKQFVLSIISGTGLGQSWTLVPSNVYIIGRENADIEIDQDTVSMHHAKLEVSRDGKITITDTGSQNGTFVDDEETSITQPRALKSGNRFQLCRLNPVVFKLEPA